MVSSVTSELILLPFLSVSLHESGTRNALLGSWPYKMHMSNGTETTWRPYLLTDQDVMSNLYRGTSIDVFYQVSVHLVKQFHRKRFKILWKFNGQTTDAMWWQKLTWPLVGELKMIYVCSKGVEINVHVSLDYNNNQLIENIIISTNLEEHFIIYFIIYSKLNFIVLNVFKKHEWKKNHSWQLKLPS